MPQRRARIGPSCPTSSSWPRGWFGRPAEGAAWVGMESDMGRCDQGCERRARSGAVQMISGADFIIGPRGGAIRQLSYALGMADPSMCSGSTLGCAPGRAMDAAGRWAFGCSKDEAAGFSYP
ncbi:hypothetical protein CBM2587_B90591 [Cupriavidus taiwanensis]|uniref:Uncharacterized protein n=1 Tax=Cupriavidus taiwanensis TaxID=164546 RepID=A0A975XF19_9BURK|nr:hypothetical protein CBM2587_B90591 [Cupriavidus taiwanensis]